MKESAVLDAPVANGACHSEPTLLKKMVMAAADLGGGEAQREFSLEDLVVAAWEMFPDTFGLATYTGQYPDSNRVSSALSGAKGLVYRGMLVKVIAKRYFVSREGLKWIAGDESKPAKVSVARIGHSLEKFALAMLDSAAVLKFEAGRKQELTFADACNFWGTFTKTPGPAIDERLEKVEGRLQELLQATGRGDVDLPNRTLTAGDVRVLANIDSHLRDRFGRHLSLARGNGIR